MVKKKLLMSSTELKRKMIDAEHLFLSIRRQCDLLELNRSGYYYLPAKESELNLDLM